ncbi:MAG: CoA pyrophosphatase [Acidimicrobiia bacterium]|nr:CoA pyrophosphatase [Acidimicrobiia bacterium]
MRTRCRHPTTRREDVDTPALAHTHELRTRIARNLATFETRPLAAGALRRAAVALTLVAGEDGFTHWILTRRQPRMRAHAGQLALPGGKCEAGEDATAAAIRELREELGVEAGPGWVLGHLDDYATRSGFLISPVVIWVDGPPTFQPDPTEVAEIFQPGLSELLRDDAPRIEAIPESDRPIVKMPVQGDHWVNAPTAAVLYQFREVGLLGRETRVAHFEQPTWAWK